MRILVFIVYKCNYGGGKNAYDKQRMMEEGLFCLSISVYDETTIEIGGRGR